VPGREKKKLRRGKEVEVLFLARAHYFQGRKKLTASGGGRDRVKGPVDRGERSGSTNRETIRLGGEEQAVLYGRRGRARSQGVASTLRWKKGKMDYSEEYRGGRKSRAGKKKRFGVYE